MATVLTATTTLAYANPVSGAPCLNLNWQLDPQKPHVLNILTTNLKVLGSINLPAGMNTFNWALDTTSGILPQIVE